jgi:hypothetical protein
MPEKDEVEKLFSPIFPVLWSSVRKAFRRFFEINQDELGAIHSRTKASYINDLVVKYLREMLPGSTNPFWENIRGQRRVWLAGSVCLRVKKVNRDLNPSNLATQAQFDFYESLLSPQARFDNMPPPIPMIFGFAMNQTKTAPDKLFLIRADGVSNSRRIIGITNIKPLVKYVIPVTDNESGSGAEYLPLIPMLPSQADDTHHRVKAKDTTKVKK